MKKLKGGAWKPIITNVGEVYSNILSGNWFSMTSSYESGKHPKMHLETFHPTKGFGYRSRRGKRSNGTAKHRRRKLR